jgi:hypothetical protein
MAVGLNGMCDVLLPQFYYMLADEEGSTSGCMYLELSITSTPYQA